MNYIVATDGGLYCYYHKDGGIWFCEFVGGVWSNIRELIPGAHRDFTVNLIDDDKPLLIWRDSDGGLKKGRFSGKDIDAKVLIAGKGEFGEYRAIPAEDGLNLVYTLPFSGDMHMLMLQPVGANGAWGAVGRVDNISAMADGLFRLVPIANKHFLAIYQSSGFESKLGYKEIYGDNIGKYNLIHSSIHSFGDCSFLATKYDLHIACVVRGVFGSRLVYKKKGADGLSPGVVVAEGQGLHNIVLYMVDEKLYLLFMKNDTLYCVEAESDGYRWNFLPLEEHEKMQSGNLAKAVFLSSRSGRGFLANELLVHSERPWEISTLSRHLLVDYKQNIQAQVAEAPEKPPKNHDDFFDNMEAELGEFLKSAPRQ